jgi:hypothetical protein
VIFEPEALSRPIGAAGRRVNLALRVGLGSYHLLALRAFDRRFFSRSDVALAVIGAMYSAPPVSIFVTDNP